MCMAFLSIQMDTSHLMMTNFQKSDKYPEKTKALAVGNQEMAHFSYKQHRGKAWDDLRLQDVIHLLMS